MLTSVSPTNFAKLVDDGIVEIADGKQRICVEISLNGYAVVNLINHPSSVDIFLNEKGQLQVVKNARSARALNAAMEMNRSMEVDSGFDWEHAEEIVAMVRSIEAHVLTQLTTTNEFLSSFSEEDEWDSGNVVNFITTFINEAKYLL
ncbi:hypothetical protein [Vibrio sp. 10N.239.312.D08]|uniref:hypothetical protein n=1 Tax=Vibrio sp. 10N.239.312.D08 TaxID=3229978 RepID=UPI003552BA80